MPFATFLIKPVSNSCNMRCRYCFYADVSKHRSVASYGVMTPQTCEATVRKALSYADEFCSFGFQGGEPTLAGLDFFKSFVRLQREYNYRNLRISNAIQTNGYKLGEDWAEFFAKNKFLAGLSLDGAQDAHDSFRTGPDGLGTYDSVAKTAEIFQKYNVDFNILCVVNSLVASRPKETYAALKKYGYLQFIPCIDDFGSDAQSPFSLGADAYAHFLKTTFDCYYSDYIRGDYVSVRNFDNYINILRGYQPEQCGMSGFCTCYFLVEADGGVYPCDFYVLDEWKLGNINEQSLMRMIKSAAAKEFVEISFQVHDECAQCKWNALCRGGCRRYREPALGGVLPLNKYCRAYKDFFAHALDRMQAIAKSLPGSYV